MALLVSQPRYWLKRARLATEQPAAVLASVSALRFARFKVIVTFEQLRRKSCAFLPLLYSIEFQRRSWSLPFPQTYRRAIYLIKDKCGFFVPLIGLKFTNPYKLLI